MSSITDAVFFFRDGQIVQEMMMAEFQALLDGIVDMPNFKGRKIAAAYLQITDNLTIRALLFFVISFDARGAVVADWNVPINQLMQSAGRGPDLGGGLIRLVSKSQCDVPWHKENLWDPPKQVYAMLVQAVKENRLGVVESDESWNAGDDWDIPVLTAADDIPTLAVSDSDNIPTLSSDDVPVLDVPTLEPAKAQNSEELQSLKQEMAAMKAAYTVRIDKLSKERDELKDKSRDISSTLKEQAKQQIAGLTQDFRHDLEQKDNQILALKEQLQNEQRRYSELKAQQAEQAVQYQFEREEMIERLQQDKAASKEIENLKVAFAKELAAKVEAETTQVNERLAMREVELFYREEQMTLLRDEIKQLKTEKQNLLNQQDHHIFEALEDNGVTMVVFQEGLGHITLAFDDIGRFLEDKNDYLAQRCGVSLEDFNLWQEHYRQPVCQHNEQGKTCAKPIAKVDMLSHFVNGISNRCALHKHS